MLSLQVKCYLTYTSTTRWHGNVRISYQILTGFLSAKQQKMLLESYTLMRKRREEFRNRLVQLIASTEEEQTSCEDEIPNAREREVLRYYYYIRHGIDSEHVAPIDKKLLDKVRLEVLQNISFSTVFLPLVDFGARSETAEAVEGGDENSDRGHQGKLPADNKEGGSRLRAERRSLRRSFFVGGGVPAEEGTGRAVGKFGAIREGVQGESFPQAVHRESLHPWLVGLVVR